jgi:hypothetical protein
METIYKFGTSEDQEWKYDNVWAIEETTGGSSRLVIASSGKQINILAALLNAMRDPFWVLYVLVVPVGEAKKVDIKALKRSRKAPWRRS